MYAGVNIRRNSDMRVAWCCLGVACLSFTQV